MFTTMVSRPVPHAILRVTAEITAYPVSMRFMRTPSLSSGGSSSISVSFSWKSLRFLRHLPLFLMSSGFV